MSRLRYKLRTLLIVLAGLAGALVGWAWFIALFTVAINLGLRWDRGSMVFAAIQVAQSASVVGGAVVLSAMAAAIFPPSNEQQTIARDHNLP